MSLTFESVCVIPGATEDEVWVSVLRTLNGVQTRCIERFAVRDFGDHTDAWFLDCAKKYDSTATTTITGLDHLEGETVGIIADGATLPTQVVSGGTVTLPTAASTVIVGIPFRSTLKPMRIEQLYANAPGGTAHGSYRKIAELVLSFLETLDAEYGIDTSHLLPMEWRTDEVYDDPPDLFTGDKIVTLDGGHDPDDPIVISTNSPQPCTLRAIVARMNVTGR